MKGGRNEQKRKEVMDTDYRVVIMGEGGGRGDQGDKWQWKICNKNKLLKNINLF